MRRDVPSSG